MIIYFYISIITPYPLASPTLNVNLSVTLSPKRTRMWLRVFPESRPFDLQFLPSLKRMIEAITFCDPLDPSSTEWTPWRIASDSPPQTYGPVKDRFSPNTTNGKHCWQCHGRKTIMPPQNSTAAHNDTSPTGPPPKLVEQTCKLFCIVTSYHRWAGHAPTTEYRH